METNPMDGVEAPKRRPRTANFLSTRDAGLLLDACRALPNLGAALARLVADKAPDAPVFANPVTGRWRPQRMFGKAFARARTNAKSAGPAWPGGDLPVM